MSESTPRRARALIDATVMFAVAALSLLLLGYVGYSEANRTYPSFLAQKLAAQAELVRNAMDNYVQVGLPLKQYVGFTTLADPIVASDAGIASLAVFDRLGRPVFASGAQPPRLLSGSATADKSLDLRRDDQLTQVVLPLRDRFETVGSIAVAMRREVVGKHLRDSFTPLGWLGAGLAIAFAAAAAAWAGSPRRIVAAYGVTFLVMAGAVVATLISLYAEGAQAKARALADSLGYRVGMLLEHGLGIDDIEGLDRTFGDYRRLNPDIAAAALIVGERAQIHTEPSRQGRKWATDGSTYDYIVTLASNPDLRVAVSLPTDLVYRQAGRAVKNFAALFVASALLASLFLQLATGQRGLAKASNDEGSNDHALRLVAPVFFLAVFAEHLMSPFLPRLLQDTAARAALSPGVASAMFMTYFLFFALTLIPAGQLAERHGPKSLVLAGGLAIVVGMATLVFSKDITALVLARAISGIGQGALFIGVQSYLLASAAPSRKTRAASVIVSGFQGGMISGVAIGSLLVTDLGPTGIFLLATTIGVGVLTYSALLLPRLAGTGGEGRLRQTMAALGRDVGRAATDADFLKTMLTVGIPSKGVLTGVIVFALPLLLGQSRFDQDDIGQIIMLYALGVLLASGGVARFVDRGRGTTTVLFVGSIAAAAGLAAIGLFGLTGQGTPSMVVLLGGMLMVGLAHGCINAPVITHVAESGLAQRIGGTQATATYRFLERLGHVGGPILAGHLLLIAGQAPVVLAWIGGGLALCALLFLVPLRRPARAAAA